MSDLSLLYMRDCFESNIGVEMSREDITRYLYLHGCGIERKSFGLCINKLRDYGLSIFCAGGRGAKYICTGRHKPVDKGIFGDGAVAAAPEIVGSVKKERLETNEITYAMNVNKTYHEVDEFRCSNCGIHIENWDTWYPPEENENEERYSEYAFKYCPNCGAAERRDDNG